MKYLMAGFNFYINASIHVAIAVVSFTLITIIQFNFPINCELLAFIFFASILGYNFIKKPGSFTGLFKESLYIEGSFKVISIISGIAAVYSLFKLSANAQWLLGLLFVLSFFYSVPLFGKTLRMFSLTKMLVVALVWAGVTVLLPVLQFDANMDNDLWFTFVQRILIIWVLTVPFEIRDISKDATTLGTLPQKFGIRAVKWQATLAAIAVLLLDQVKFEQINSYSLVNGIMMGVSILLVWFASVKQSKYYASFWVESVPMLWLGILMIFENYPEISF